jgi:arginase
VRVALIQVPYYLGHEEVSWGAGPVRLVEAGAADALAQAGHQVEVERVKRSGRRTDDIAGSFEVMRLVATHVAAAAGRGAFPVALGGNCQTTVGVAAGLSTELGVVWLDAHPDFNTPEATVGGHLDAMSLSILTGTGWGAIRATIPGYRPFAESRVVLVGMRAAQPEELARLDASAIALVPPHEPVEPALDALCGAVADVHVHLDLDVLDPSEGRANEYAADGGLSAANVERVIDAVASRFRVRSTALTAYDPAFDPDGSLAATAIEFLVRVVGAASRQPAPA